MICHAMDRPGLKRNRGKFTLELLTSVLIVRSVKGLDT